MEQNPSSEANSHSAGEETSCLLWNPKVNYQFTKPTVGPHPEPNESNPHGYTLFI